MEGPEWEVLEEELYNVYSGKWADIPTSCTESLLSF